MVDTQDSRTSGEFSLLEWIGDRLSPLAKLRDGILVAAVIVYILGYLVWSINAFRNNLGLLPALEFQYFTAGVFPAVLIWLVYSGLRNARRITANLVKWIGPDAKGGLRYLRWFIRGIFWVIGFGGIVLGGIYIVGIKITVFPLMIRVLGLIMMAVFLLYLATDKRYSRWDRTFFWSYVLILFFITGLVFYLFVGYPKLPQSLGGLQPRCVYLDVKKAELSNETLEDIFPVEVTRSSSEVVRSVKVDFFFSGGDFMWVRRHIEKQGVKHKLYEIRKGAVQAVISCE